MIKINFSEQEILELHKARFNYPVPRVQNRCEALYLKAMGLSHSDICQICRISKVSLVKYLKMYIDNGIESLKEWKYNGKANSLSDHSTSLEDYFRKNPPLNSKQARFDIEKLTGIKRGLTQVKEFLHGIGMKFRKTGSIPKDADTQKKQKEQKDFLKKKSNPASLKQKPAKGWYFS